jgi:uncharacterized hydantoinase/oxoprolinase family protein
MSFDTLYSASTTLGSIPDNVVGDDGNYRQISGARSRVARTICAEWKEIDGESIGNKAWRLLERELDTPHNRTLLAFHTEQSVKSLVDAGDIRDLEITTGDAANTQGVGMLVKFFDVREGDISTAGFIAPWGKS